MAQREYKEMSCRNLGMDCDFLVRAEKEEEVMSLVNEHICRVHGACYLTPDLKDKMQGSMKSFCCQGGCYEAPKMTGESCWDAF